MNNNDSDVLNQANYILNKYSNPQYRFNTITVEMAELTPTQQLQILSKELTDTLYVKFTPNGIGDPIQKYAQIIGIKHYVGNFTHRVTFNLDTLDFAPFVLDDSQFGILGGSIESYDYATTTYDDTIVYDGSQDPNGNRLG